MLSSADIEVACDAFLEQGRQISDVEIVREHVDPFEPSTHGAPWGIWSNDPVRVAVAMNYGGFDGHEIPLDSTLPAIARSITPSLPARMVRKVMSAHERGSANRSVYGWLCRREIDDDLEVAAIDGPATLQRAAADLINFEREGKLSSPAYDVRRRELTIAALNVLWHARPGGLRPLEISLRARILDGLEWPAAV